MGLLEELSSKRIERRDFLKLCGAVTAAFSLPLTFQDHIASAAEQAMAKPRVIWLEGQDCAGCSESFLATMNPSVAELVLDTLSIRYHETIMGASGEVAEKALRDTMKEGGYILVVEGSIPKADDRFCLVGGKPFRETVMEVAENAALVIGAGSCAMYGGGIPGATPSMGGGVGEFVKNKPLINLPSCPVKPSRLVATVLYYLAAKKAPPLDSYNRPVAFYGSLIHDNCPRRGQFEKGNFLTDWNDPEQRGYCLLKKGCKGPKTYSDCAQVWWNEGASFCMNAGAPCAGCGQPEFYKEFSPLYANQETLGIGFGKSVNVDTAGAFVIGATAAGVAVHGIGRVIAGKGPDANKEDELG